MSLESLFSLLLSTLKVWAAQTKESWYRSSIEEDKTAGTFNVDTGSLWNLVLFKCPCRFSHAIISWTYSKWASTSHFTRGLLSSQALSVSLAGHLIAKFQPWVILVISSIWFCSSLSSLQTSLHFRLCHSHFRSVMSPCQSWYFLISLSSQLWRSWRLAPAPAPDSVHF